MQIKLVNLKNGTLSLDLVISEDISPIRVTIPKGGYVNIGDLVSLDELNMSENLKALVAAGSLSISVVGDSDDVPGVVGSTVLRAIQVTAASVSIPLGIVTKSGTIITAQAGTIAVAASGEDMSIDILKNGTTILDAAIVVDDSVTARNKVDGVLDTTVIQVVSGDFLEAVLTYTAGGGATPIVGTVVEVELIPA